jgi:hypothetical protein
LISKKMVTALTISLVRYRCQRLTSGRYETDKDEGEVKATL